MYDKGVNAVQEVQDPDARRGYGGGGRSHGPAHTGDHQAIREYTMP